MSSGEDSSSSSSDDNWLISPNGAPVLLSTLDEADHDSIMLLTAVVLEKDRHQRNHLLDGRRRRGGSRRGRSANIPRSFQEVHDRFMLYYFVDRPSPIVRLLPSGTFCLMKS